MLVADPAIDLVIVDLGLPDMGGAEVVSRARALRPGLPVIVASGRDIDGDVADVVELPKPYDLASLLNAVARACEKLPASGIR